MSVLYYFRSKILKYRNNTGLAYFTVFNKTVYVPNLLLSNVSFYAKLYTPTSYAKLYTPTA